MMTHIVKLKPSQVPQAWKNAFPNYRGRTFRLEVETTVDMGNGYWSGGSRSEYRTVALNGGTVSRANEGIKNPFGLGTRPELYAVPLPTDQVVVEHCIFCGKDMGLRFHVHPDAVDKVPQLKGLFTLALQSG